MKAISFYILLVLIFLGLSKSFSISSKGTPYIANEKVYSNYFKGSPLTVILVDAFKTGFIIQTYYHRYLVLHGFKSPYYQVVRTSKKYFEKNLNNLGMSLFRRSERKGEESVIPLPPGSIYVGNPAFGSWERQNSGERIWQFHRAYKSFAENFGWGEFRPSKEYFQKLTEHAKLATPFYGLKNEFGSKGEISQRLVKKMKPKEEVNYNLTLLFKKFFSLPPWKLKKDM